MYPLLLAVHSWLRWFILASLLFAIYRGYKGWLTNKPFSKFDNSIRHWTATIAHIQLTAGISLYFISPLIDYFLHHYKDAVYQRQIRFFGMEHSVMMIIAIIIITIGSMKAKRMPANKRKFKAMAIWFTIALIIILISIPWPFSTIAGRPYFRAF